LNASLISQKALKYISIHFAKKHYALHPDKATMDKWRSLQINNCWRFV